MKIPCDIVGWKFHPSDEQIINYYLNHKLNGRDFLVDHAIGEIDLLQHNPQDIPALAKMSSDDNQYWYFFYRHEYKYSNSKRAARKTKRGYWKLTGNIRSITVKGEEIGGKRTLVYHDKSWGSKPKRTNWIIHEYQARTMSILPHQSGFTLCKMKYKADEKSSVDKWIPKKHETQSQMLLPHSDNCQLSSGPGPGLTFNDSCEHVVDPITLVDSFLGVDDWLCDDQTAENHK